MLARLARMVILPVPRRKWDRIVFVRIFMNNLYTVYLAVAFTRLPRWKDFFMAIGLAQRKLIYGGDKSDE